MGVDCKLYLHPLVGRRDALVSLAAALGKKIERVTLSAGRDPFDVAKQNDLATKDAGGQFECFLIDGAGFFLTWHSEAPNPLGEAAHLMMARSTPVWVGAARAIARLWGGILVPRDWSAEAELYPYKMDLWGESDAPFHRRHAALLAMKPSEPDNDKSAYNERFEYR